MNEDLPPDLQEALDELSDHYEAFERNDRGGSGYLFFARNRVTQAEVALKFYAGEPGEKRHDEPKQLSAIKSGNVLSILDARNVSEEWGYFITPLCFEGDLDDLIATQPSVHRAVDVALGVCNGVGAIHAVNMLHRDLKPGNIVMLRGAPQIADFGSVRQVENLDATVSASKHSVLFRPPESFSTGEYSLRGDIYQVGLVTFQLLGGMLPYDGEEYLSGKQRRLFEQIEGDTDRQIFLNDVIRERAERGKLLDFGSLPAWITRGARRMLRELIHPDPAARMPSIADVAASLTEIRASSPNWGWSGDVAELDLPDRTIQLRPTAKGDDLFETFQALKPDGEFRRIPGWQADALAGLVNRLG